MVLLLQVHGRRASAGPLDDRVWDKFSRLSGREAERSCLIPREGEGGLDQGAVSR